MGGRARSHHPSEVTVLYSALGGRCITRESSLQPVIPSWFFPSRTRYELRLLKVTLNRALPALAVQSISLHSTGCDKCMTMLPSRLMISQHARWVQESLYSVPSGKCCLGEERGMDTTEQVLGVLGGYLHGWFRVRGTRRHHFVLTR
jgi:hypothetical protein